MPPQNRRTGEPLGEKMERRGWIISQKVCFFGCGGFLLVSGVVFVALWSIIFNSILKKELVLSPTSKSYGLWKDIPIPLYIDFYMFNWTNPKESLEQGELPNFHQMGPYVFREYHKKVNLKWNSNGTVTFQQVRSWQFIPELSQGQLSDTVTNLNVIAITISSMIKKYLPKILIPLIAEIISIKEPPFVTRTVGELLFYGYKDPFLDIASRIKPYIKELDLPFDKFGWFYGRNMSSTYDGIFNMYTGSTDADKVGVLSAWNYTSQTRYFKDKCGRVGGTTGELWPLNSAKLDTANVFAPDICSTMLLSKKGPVEVSGLAGTMFTGSEEVFDSRACYCINGKCPLRGAREISTCRWGAPAYVSFPHFYQADPRYNTMVKGLQPDPEKHSFLLALQQDSGVPLQVNARLQVNLWSEPVTNLSLFSKLPRAMMPMLWFDQHAMMTDELASELKVMQTADEFGIPVTASTAVLGLLLVLVGLFLWHRGYWQPTSETNSLISQGAS